MMSHKIVELLLCSFIFAALADQRLGIDVCSPSKCGRHGPTVRFPFRIKGKQAKHCGYHGFDLSCENEHTVLELPNSMKLFVKKINYKSQVIHGSDPQGCLPRHLRNFSLFGDLFQYAAIKHNKTLFNCSATERRLFMSESVPCLNDRDHKVYVVWDEAYIYDVDIVSCTKLYSVLAPDDMFAVNNVISLSWSAPNCGELCESKGKYCRVKNDSSESEIECYGPRKEGSTRKYVIAGSTLCAFLTMVFLAFLYYVYRTQKADEEFVTRIEQFLEDYKAFKPTRYSYYDVKRITNNFKVELGQGAYGTVFKGKLSNEILVAVKVLNNSTGNGEEFVNEVGTMGRIHHVNVVRLIGFCAEGFTRALLYDYLPNESLQKVITSPDNKNFLGWKRVHDIALGVAKGIEYLHQGCDQRILHFDIKPHNVLLDQDFIPKITDFGMAKLCAKDQSAVSMTTARGTIGYIAPEVFSRNFGSVSHKSDVYSFGMLVLEMVGGRKNFDETNNDRIYFPEWIYNLLEESEELRFHIEDEIDAKIAKKLAVVGLWCIQWKPVDRPSMKFVVQILEDEVQTLPTPPNPFSSKNSTQEIHGRQAHQKLPTISESE